PCQHALLSHFCFYHYLHHRHLPPFPTRRSSDLEYSEIIIHVQFHETNASLQQITLGVMGVNLIYGAFYKYDNPKELLKSLYDHIDRKSTRLNSSHVKISYAVFCLKKKKNQTIHN